MRKIYLLASILVMPVVLSGCFNLAEYDQAILEKNQEISDKAREKVDEGVEAGKEKLKEYTKEQFDNIVASLTDSMKNSIDEWLDQNGLNKYGDPQGTMYAGGTPLFDEATGKTTDKYEYILEQHPELVNELNLEN